ncbi:MAG: PilZ domain-containing protein [Oscillospiraceae bacterium]
MGVSLENYVGCACEIKTMDNELLLPGKIQAVLDDGAAQSLEIVSSDGGDMPNAAYGIPVKINIFSSKHGFLGAGGRVYITHNTFWRINEIKFYGENEWRGFFRIKNHSHAEVFGIDEYNQGRKYSCIVTSVSLSGVLIAVSDPDCYFQIGSVLDLIDFSVGEGTDKFTVKCRVKRQEEHPVLGKLYGCELEGMNAKQADRLCQAIFAQQRAEIRRKRGRM